MTSKKNKRNVAVVGVPKDPKVVYTMEEYYVDVPISESYYKSLLGNNTYNFSYDTPLTAATPGNTDRKSVSVNPAQFGLDNNSSFEIEIQVAMRYGNQPWKNPVYVGTRGVVFLRRGMFTLD